MKILDHVHPGAVTVFETQVDRSGERRSRNGGRDLAQIHEHMAKDDLVAYGWKPGTGRAPAPGTQERAGELIQAWIDSGAECP